MGQYCHLHTVQVEEDGCYSSQVGHGLSGLSVLDQDTVQLVLKVFHSNYCDNLSNTDFFSSWGGRYCTVNLTFIHIHMIGEPSNQSFCEVPSNGL